MPLTPPTWAGRAGTESQVVIGFASECVLCLGEVGGRGGWVGGEGSLGRGLGTRLSVEGHQLGNHEKLDCGWLSLGQTQFSFHTFSVCLNEFELGFFPLLHKES